MTAGFDVAVYDADPDAPEAFTALCSLPPKMRAVIVLRYLEQYSEQETAAMLQCSVGTVKSASHKGLAKLRDRLGPRTNATTAGGRP
jgi:RNA polymerase sigma factor (sigma-70 family)